MTRPEFINADFEDYAGIAEFVPTGVRIAWKTGTSINDLKWSRLYNPTDEVVRMDHAPENTNIAVGNRRGWAYATMKVTGRDPHLFIPGAAYNEFGVKIRLTFAKWDFESGTHAVGETVDAWVAIEDAEQRVQIIADRKVELESIV